MLSELVPTLWIVPLLIWTPPMGVVLVINTCISHFFKGFTQGWKYLFTRRLFFPHPIMRIQQWLNGVYTLLRFMRVSTRDDTLSAVGDGYKHTDITRAKRAALSCHFRRSVLHCSGDNVCPLFWVCSLVVSSEVRMSRNAHGRLILNTAKLWEIFFNTIRSGRKHA